MTFAPPPKFHNAVLIQQAYGEYECLLDATEVHHADYAERWHMDYWPVRSRFGNGEQEGRHPNWDCIALVREAQDAGYEHVFCLDADAVIWDILIDLRAALRPGTMLGMVLEDRSDARQGDGPRRGEPFFNAGALYIRNSPETQDFFRDVWDIYPHENTQYEQGAINWLLPRLGGRFQQLDSGWNYCPRIFSPSKPPRVLAYHGDPIPHRLRQIKVVLASLPHLTFGPVIADPVLNVQIAVHGGYEDIFACVLSVLANTRSPFRIHLWDNASDPTTAALLDFLGKKLPAVTLTVSPSNVGFGEAHNAMVHAPSEEPCAVTCFLNSDCTVGEGWDAEPVGLLLSDPCLGAAGAVSGEQNGTAYLEGSCLLMRTAVAAEFGPFDAVRFPVAYYEDADLSARLTWAGYALAALPHLPVRHAPGSATTARVQAAYRETGAGADVLGQRVANRETFRARWHTPPAPPEIVLRRGGAIGDLLCCTPLVSALRQQNPLARIVFVTNNLNMFLGNPDLDDVRLDSVYTPNVLEFVDRVNPEPSMLWPSEVTAHSVMHLIDVFANLAGVELTAGRALTLPVFPHERAWARTHLPPRYAVVSPHTSWHTKDWVYWAEFLPRFIAQSGLAVVLLGAGASYLLPPLEEGVGWRGSFAAHFPLAEKVVGANMRRIRESLGPLVEAGLLRDFRGRTRLRQAVGAVAEAEMLIGLDSGLSHVAAAVGTPAVLMNGPVDARSTAHPGQTVLSTPLACGACYQRNKYPHIPWNDGRCSRADDGGYVPLLVRPHPALPKEGADCMAAISVEALLSACAGAGAGRA